MVIIHSLEECVKVYSSAAEPPPQDSNNTNRIYDAPITSPGIASRIGSYAAKTVKSHADFIIGFSIICLAGFGLVKGCQVITREMTLGTMPKECKDPNYTGGNCYWWRHHNKDAWDHYVKERR